ncbi:hypothetical protein Taro_056826, partial [Colocasia esculenta]|nr:hypothetical protein [Colocasia esculenta]
FGTVDIHPAVRIGKGILFDHATDIRETTIVSNNVPILHHVMLGGTGKAIDDRHPKIADYVLIGAGAMILGNIEIGARVKIGVGSLVLIDMLTRTTAVGNLTKLIGGKEKPSKFEDIHGESMDHTSSIAEWSEYIV